MSEPTGGQPGAPADHPTDGTTPAAGQSSVGQPAAGQSSAGRPAGQTPRRPRRAWLSPGGISAVAAVAAVLVAAIGLFMQREPASLPAPPPSATTPTESALFVYGSSMPGMSRYDVIGRYVVRSARDTVQGSLYDSGLGYPLARFDGGGVVRGFVLWLDPSTAEQALTDMTRVEAGLFSPVTVRTATGVTATAYQWIGGTDGFPRIDSWDGTTAHYGSGLTWPELQVGDCFQQVDDLAVLTSWCEAPHALEAFHAGTLPEGGADPRAAAETVCTAAFSRFVGRGRSKSELISRAYAQSASESGRPQFLCAIGQDGATTVGTLRGSDR